MTGSTATFDLVPRTVDEQLAWLAEHRGPYPAIVAVDDGETVLGFGSLSEYKNRPSYATTVENSVYVERPTGATGWAVLLLQELVELATQHGFHSVIARVGGDNTGLHRPPSGLRVHPGRGGAGGGAQVQPLAGRHRPPAPALIRSARPVRAGRRPGTSPVSRSDGGGDRPASRPG